MLRKLHYRYNIIKYSWIRKWRKFARHRQLGGISLLRNLNASNNTISQKYVENKFEFDIWRSQVVDVVDHTQTMLHIIYFTYLFLNLLNLESKYNSMRFAVLPENSPRNEVPSIFLPFAIKMNIVKLKPLWANSDHLPFQKRKLC